MFFSLSLFLFSVIQETPKASEKLYILDSIDVPLSELNKYRHLSVVNKLPENIILPPPPPLRHESSAPDSHATEPTKPTAVVESHTANSNHTHQVKNDFEANVHYDEADLVETKNISIIQHVKKIIKKYQKGKHREQMRAKSKIVTNNIHVTNEHSNDLSTPLRSLSPAHGFDVDMPSAVDLSVNSKEIIDEFEFIDNLSICSDDSESGYGLMASPLTEYLELTEPQSLVVGGGGGGGGGNKHDTNEKIEKIPNPNENCDKTNEPKEIQVKEIKELENNEEKEEETKSEDENKKEIENEEKVENEKEVNEVENQAESDEKNETRNENQPTSEILIETLRNICIKTFNSENFRSYFTENVINISSTEDTDATPSTPSESDSCIEKAEHEIADSPKNNDDSIESTDEPIEKLETGPIEDNLLPSSSPPHSPPPPSQVPSLRRLAINAVLLNQSYMSRNLKPFKSVFDAESERRMIDGSNADSGAYRVRTLQELAREVAVTIYSFNVKPLQDMCRLAIEKFNHLYLMNRFEPSDANSVPECAVPIENLSNLHGIYCISIKSLSLLFFFFKYCNKID